MAKVGLALPGKGSIADAPLLERPEQPLTNQGMTCTKVAVSGIVLFLFNCLYLFSGIIFTVGWIIPLLNNPDHVQGDRRGYFQHTAFHDWRTLRILLTSGGLLLFCTSILGCVASVKKKVWMLIATSLFLVLCIGLQISGGLKNATNRVASDMWSEKGFTKVMQTYWLDPKAPLAKVADHFQLSYECCGYHSYQDWNSSSLVYPEQVPSNAILGSMPRSCCIERGLCSELSEVYHDGCKRKIATALGNWKSNVHLTHAIVMTIVLLEIVGLFLSMQMVNWLNTIKENEDRMKAIYGPTRL